MQNISLTKSTRSKSCSSDCETTVASIDNISLASVKTEDSMLPIAAVDAESDQGPRRYNEDRYSILIDNDGVLTNSEGTAMFCVFDGHGGDSAAEYCEKHFPDVIMEKLRNGYDAGDALAQSFQKVEDGFYKEVGNTALKVGTTAVVTMIQEKTLYCGWTGDSEAWLFRNDAQKVCKLMDAHRPLRVDERRRIEKLGGMVTFENVNAGVDFRNRKRIGRVNGQLAVSRAIGDRKYKNMVPAEPEITETALDGTESFMVLGSDGLWDVLSPVEVASIVKTFVNNQAKCFDPTVGAAKHLIAECQKKGDVDNVTALIVFFPSFAPNVWERIVAEETGCESLTSEGQHSISDATVTHALQNAAMFFPRAIPRVMHRVGRLLAAVT